MSDNQLVKVSDATADLVEYENEEPPPPRPCRKHHGCAPKWRYAPFYGGAFAGFSDGSHLPSAATPQPCYIFILRTIRS
jgi:hypothetical protein